MALPVWGRTDTNPWQFQQVKTAAGQQFDVQPNDQQLWDTFLQWGQAPDAGFMQKILSNLYSLPKTYFGSAPAPEAAPEPPAPTGDLKGDLIEDYLPDDGGGGGGGGGGGAAPTTSTRAPSDATSQPITPATISAVNAQAPSMQAGSPTVPGSPYSKLIEESIQKLLTRGFTPVSENDPEIRAQFQPTANVLERGARRSREEQAERLAFGGANVGGAGGPLDAVVQQIRDSTTLQEGQLMAGLVAGELQARRDDVTNALGFAQGEDRIRLAAQQTQIDAELRRIALALNERQIELEDILGHRGLDIQEALGQGQLALGHAGLGVQSGAISNQNSQFYDRLAFDIAQEAYDRSNPFAAGSAF